MPSRGRVLVIMTNSYLVRPSHICDLNLEIICLPSLKVVRLIVKPDLIRFAFITIDNEVHIGISACTSDITSVYPCVPCNLYNDNVRCVYFGNPMS